jgi:hypothetical protein
MTLEHIPDWSVSQETGSVPDFEPAARAAAELAGMDPEERRETIDAFSRDHCFPRFELDRASGLYLVLRLLFDLPDAYPLDETKVFGGWVHPSIGRDPFDLSWPVRVDADEKTFSVDRFRSYRGKGYDAIGEYDFLSERFPLRAARLLSELRQVRE